MVNKTDIYKPLEGLRIEVNRVPENKLPIRNYLLAKGYREHYDDPNVIARAYAIKALFEGHEKHIYENDLIAGSVRGLLGGEELRSETEAASRIVSSYGSRDFVSNADHFAPDYETILSVGISGMLASIDESINKHREEPEKLSFLRAARITMEALGNTLALYADKAEGLGKSDLADTCRKISSSAPSSFREALQLVWMIHTCFYLEGRYAMALGRLDNYLYPFFKRDIESGAITRDEALSLVECTLYKIREAWYFGGDNVVNIAIGGVDSEGNDATNALSYLILEAVGNCNIPGPNLSARLHKNTSPEFYDACLRVIGTGLGYPALMNDEINIPALHRHGYSLADSRGYCMVGCIENFIPGKQPPWSDGRYNTPKYIELALNNGVCMLTGNRIGPATGDASELVDMDSFMKALEAQMVYGASEYMMLFKNHNERLNRGNYQSPFLSCFCRDCIGRGLDINNGGALYPSVHGAGCMGIATVADSLAAIEKLVYNEKKLSLSKLREALQADFKGYDDLRRELLAAPKYGNDDDFVDKYAVWFVAIQDSIFSRYRTYDGGAIYTAIASNVSNIPAGKEIAATPDGRLSGSPVSDAASPMHGRDRSGPTAVINSLTKPDYSLVSCGTVLNQKYSPDMFKDPVKRTKLAALIRTYFAKGGQEIQINSVSRAILTDAITNPGEYRNLVVRVSGFSAYYTLLSREVQEDILARTEHE